MKQFSRKILVIVSFCFFLSGAAGLIYEVVWSRILSLTFGTTLPAVTTVLSAFMGGLALGGFVFGRLADKWGKPLPIYGILEVGIGIYGLFTPLLFRYADSFYAFIFHMFDRNMFWFHLLRFFICFLILIIPTSLMGGTLPILSRYFIRRKAELGTGLGLLYGLNTLGAVIGTLSAGFIFIRFVGVNPTIMIAAISNIIIGGFIVFLYYFAAKRPAADEQVAEGDETKEEAPEVQEEAVPGVESMAEAPEEDEGVSVKVKALPPWFFIAAYFAAGFGAMACEVAWTRAMTLIIGSSVYAFTLMLSAFLTGLALGGAALGRIADRHKDPLILFAGLELGIGFFVLSSIVLLGRMPVLFLDYFSITERSFAGLQFIEFFLISLIMFVPTFLMGAAFPVVNRLYVRNISNLGRKVGDLYFVNTLGGIGGSTTAGFLLIPAIGSQSTLTLAACLFLTVGLVAFLLNRAAPVSKRVLSGSMLVVLSVVYVLSIRSWNPLLMTSGIYVYAPNMEDGFEADRKFLFYEEGLHSQVAVTKKSGIKSLRINGKTDGSSGADMKTQVLLAQIPMIMHEEPEKVLIIGWGTGVTAGSAAKYEKADIEAVEIDSLVVEASKFFAEENHNALDDPQIDIILADARTYLRNIPRKYDVIISEPSNPWITGVSNLFTSDQFQIFKNKLKHNGVVCQWIHAYYMEPEDLKTIFRTFLHVFPHVTLWEGSEGDYLMLGSLEPKTVLPATLTERINERKLAGELSSIEIYDIQDLIDRFLMNTESLGNFVGKGPLNTDQRPIIEFNAPHALFKHTYITNKKMIEEAALDEFPGVLE